MEYINDEDGGARSIGEVLPPLSHEVSPVVSAEISQQVATARRFPRRRDKEIADEIMGRAALNDQIASECMYSLKRGRGSDAKVIPGASIRFAEIVRASYGNIRVAARFVRLDLDDPERGAVIVEAVALDVQTNQSEIIQVRRSVMTSGGEGRKPRLYNADMINMTVNAAQSIARRNAILAVVPKAIWIEGYQRVVKVLKGDASTLDKRRTEIIAAFVKIGVDPKDVYAALGVKDINDVGIDHMPELRGFMTAISEGETPASVLGKAAEAANGDHTKVKSPLSDDSPSDTATTNKPQSTGEAPASSSTSTAGPPAGDGAAAAANPVSQQSPENKNAAPAEVSSATEAQRSEASPNPRTEKGGASPSPLYAAFADALARATQPKSLKSLTEQFWNRNEYPHSEAAVIERLDKIHGVHVRRIKGDINLKQAQEELKELIVG